MLTCSRRPDSYHTCYTLSGLSTTEHFHGYDNADSDSTRQFASAFSWAAVKKKTNQRLPNVSTFEDGTHVNSMHPVFAIPHRSAMAIREWSERQPKDL